MHLDVAIRVLLFAKMESHWCSTLELGFPLCDFLEAGVVGLQCLQVVSVFHQVLHTVEWGAQLFTAYAVEGNPSHSYMTEKNTNPGEERRAHEEGRLNTAFQYLQNCWKSHWSILVAPGEL